MITLAQHIEMLLLEHDCVIIPGFGGFISNHREAQYEEDGGMLMPPSRTIGFNQQLQINDGLLAQSYMSAYDASYPAAQLQMEKDIEAMSQELELNGFYYLESIGRLTKGMGAGISFEASAPSILTPSLYGLDSFSMQPVKEIVKKREIEARMQAASIGISEEKHEDAGKNDENDKKKGIVIKLSPRMMEVGVSVAAAILLFFITSYMATRDRANETDTVIAATYPTPNSHNIEPNSHNIEDGESIVQMEKTHAHKAQKAPRAATASKKTVDKEEIENTNIGKKGDAVTNDKVVTNESTSGMGNDISNKTSETQSSEKTTGNSEASASSAKYTIVLASYVTRANADSFIRQMAKDGFAKAEYVKRGKVSRIIYSGYATEQEAQNALSLLRKNSKEFAEAWVMAL